MFHIPYQGGGPAVTAVLGGQMARTTSTVGSALIRATGANWSNS
ncbi:MAG: hypothetical protein GEV13_22440 [Rhodospirillales bacterium]|nr:hypothetical protein [Rhodospirillales bacterium]